MVEQTSARCQPTRATGVEIVNCIVIAAGQILTSSSLEEMTTNRIAERAGVSIGSVYRYFPNKQAVVAAVMRDVNERLIAGLRAAANQDAPFDVRLHSLIAALCSDTVGSLSLRAALLHQVPRNWDVGLDAAEKEATAILKSLLREGAPDWTEDDLEDHTIAFGYAARGAVQGALLHRPSLVASGRLTDIVFQLLDPVFRGSGEGTAGL